MSKLAATPGTKSYVLFHLSETVEFKTKGISASDSDLNISDENLGIQHHSVHHNIDVHNLFNCYVYVNKIAILGSTEEALHMYIF